MKSLLLIIPLLFVSFGYAAFKNLNVTPTTETSLAAEVGETYTNTTKVAAEVYQVTPAPEYQIIADTTEKTIKVFKDTELIQTFWGLRHSANGFSDVAQSFKTPKGEDYFVLKEPHHSFGPVLHVNGVSPNDLEQKSRRVHIHQSSNDKGSIGCLHLWPSDMQKL